jgi:CBS domain-containing protein
VGDESADEVARQFSDHDWVSAPVVDDNNILLGRITIDDVVDIIRVPRPSTRRWARRVWTRTKTCSRRCKRAVASVAWCGWA